MNYLITVAIEKSSWALFKGDIIISRNMSQLILGNRHMTGAHLTIQGTLTAVILSNIILTLQMVGNIDLGWEF